MSTDISTPVQVVSKEHFRRLMLENILNESTETADIASDSPRVPNAGIFTRRLFLSPNEKESELNYGEGQDKAEDGAKVFYRQTRELEKRLAMKRKEILLCSSEKIKSGYVREKRAGGGRKIMRSLFTNKEFVCQ